MEFLPRRLFAQLFRKSRFGISGPAGTGVFGPAEPHRQHRLPRPDLSCSGAGAADDWVSLAAFINNPEAERGERRRCGDLEFHRIVLIPGAEFGRRRAELGARSGRKAGKDAAKKESELRRLQCY